MIKEPSAMAIFLLLGHDEQVEKLFNEWVIWSMLLESIVQELGKVKFKIFNPIEKTNSPEYDKEQVPNNFPQGNL